ncbi:uncharacterized protein LOC117608951 isoform X1 [Osmia lignaria lignaria]|uniref:uncharacterized protein LOC117608951 isoform X1 n=2 Tax=Osmia lignaria lignaria TaxID=1437193 RepID=UPI00402B0974
MEVKRTEMEIFRTKKTYYDDLNETKNGSDSFWEIFIALCVVLILIIVFITCYHYIHGKIIYIICKRCFTWLNKKNDTDDNVTIKNESNRGTTRRRSMILKPHKKFNDQKEKLYKTKSYAFRTPLQEKKKLLSSHTDKTITSSSNIALTKRLFLKLSVLSSDTSNKNGHDQTSNNWNTCNEQCTQRNEKFYQNSHKGEKSICFSDTDVKFLVIPVSSKKSNENRNKEICKWNSKDNNYDIRNNTSSKLIELQYENRDSFSNNVQKYEVSTSKLNLPCSFVSKNVATDSLSNSVVNQLDILPNLSLNKLKRSTNSHIGSTVSGVSNATHLKSEENSFMDVADSATISEIDKLQRKKSDEYNVYSKKMKMKMKSSMDMLRNQIKEINSERKIKSEDNLMVLSIKNENTKNYFMFKKDITSIHEQYIESPLTSLNHSSETNEIYDELGILFSQYMKLQIKSCRRKYCIRSRHLKKIQHSTRKCQVRFNYHQIYPYDQRPTCNCGNICEDTYDELKLMSTLPLERKNIYYEMFTRRKQFLNQPCILINQEFISN